MVVYCQARIVVGREGGGDMMRGGGVDDKGGGLC